jgi:hypothetical protein
VVVPVPLTSDAIINQLLRCQILIQSFDKQIRRIIISSHDLTPRRSRSKLRSTIAVKRSLPNSDQLHSKHADQMTPTDSPSGVSAEKKRDGSRRRRAISTVSMQFHTTDNLFFYFIFQRVLMVFHHVNHFDEHYRMIVIRHIIH